MQKYSSNAIELFYNSKYSGATIGADAIAKNENKETGEVAKFYIVVRDNKIKSISFQAFGSINLFACMTTLCELSSGKSLEEAEKITEKDIIASLKQISKQDYSKVTFSILTLKKVITLYRKKRDKGTLNQRDSRKKEVFPSKNITVFNNIKESKLDLLEESEMVTSKTIKDLQKTDDLDKKVDSKKIEKSKSTSKAKANTSKNSTKNKNRDKSAKVPKNVEEKPQKKVVAPTKIEVRIVDEPENSESPVAKVVTTTTKPEKKVNGEIVENSKNTKTKFYNQEGVESENMIDEIDSITEQLTNAISQLNFKFDETPEEERKTKKKKRV